jgi:amino acid transporter
MILGMSVETFTVLHVIISIAAILSGLVVLLAMIANRKADGGLAAFFLLTTILTSVTGFFFHSKAIGPPHIVGVISLVVLAVTLIAIYGRRLAGIWRGVFVITAVLALYLNCFVLVVQLFQKIPSLNAFAPTGTEPPFVAAQGATLLLFLVLGFLAFRRFHPV